MSAGGRDNLRRIHRENIAAFRVFADAIHDAGGKIFGQTFYWWGGYGQWQPLSPPAPSLGPSTRQFGYSDRTVSTHAMSKDEISAMHAAIRQSASNLREAGFDGIMLHASHAGLIEQFLSPYFNQRTDEYGGSLENRMRFLVESLQAAREGAGRDMAVGMRFNCDEMLPGGYGTDTAREVVKEICERGLVDYVDLDVGVEPQQFHHGMPTVFTEPQLYRPFVEAVRGAAGNVPVLSVLGRVTSHGRCRSGDRRRRVRCGGRGAAAHRRTTVREERARGQGRAQPDLHRLQLVYGGAG